jgi:hypothetical protein
MNTFTIRLEVTLYPEWELAEFLRFSVIDLLASAGHSRPSCEGHAMVVGELVENAIKYGDWTGGHPQDAFSLTLRAGPYAAEISVTNGVGNVDRAVELLTRIERMRAKDPAEAYLERLQEVAASTEDEGGLGLIRVMYEGGCRLSADVSAGGIVTVRAVTAPDAWRDDFVALPS